MSDAQTILAASDRIEGAVNRISAIFDEGYGNFGSKLISALEALTSSDTSEQKPGCLPQGYTLDSMLTPEQFCVWQQVGVDWFSRRQAKLPGVIAHSRKMVRIHPRTYIEGTK